MPSPWQRRSAIARGYRSGLEAKNAEHLKSLGVKVRYEDPTTKLAFIQPEKRRTYLPDFKLPNGIYIETKGRFTAEDRKKHLWVKEQYPHIDLRFVFTRSAAKLYKGSKTTYAQWCIKHGFQYADKLVPEEWVRERAKRGPK